MIISEANYLEHYGTPRHSGRYPWGSGGNDSSTRHESFLGFVAKMKADGLTEKQIVEGLGLSSVTELRTMKTIARNAKKQSDIAMAESLKLKGMGSTEIGKRMGIPEPTVRSLLAPGAKDKADVLNSTATMLREHIQKKGAIDVGSGVETQLGISREKLNTAIALLRDEGYAYHKVQEQNNLSGTTKTTIKVLAKPQTTYIDLVTGKTPIKLITDFSDDGGRSYLGVQTPLSVSSKRLAINYAETGGNKADGVIYLRPGVDDLSLGGKHYAQVRIAIDGTHYLKGMAMHKDDLPAGVDIVFNTNKSNTGNKLDALKPMNLDKDGNVDADNPFGALIRQRIDPKTNKVVSAINIVGLKEGSGEEGGWDDWSRSLSSQMLSKQTPKLAEEQLRKTYDKKKEEFDELSALTNPTVRRALLMKYADGADSAAVHLKGAALPRQGTHVILPINSLKENEIYAPNYRPGEKVVLVRYPHGGIFEIPELTVNNRNREARKMLGTDTQDAVGIHHKVAERLSGADFDGDTVIVIPQRGNIKTAPALAGLKNFDPKHSYPPVPGTVFRGNTQKLMGDVSNLITDMTVQRASSEELARAVRHSMVVIDAEKHNLNYKESAIRNNIAQLKEKYQFDPSNPRSRGASTLISRARSEARVPQRKPIPIIDPATGKKTYRETGESYTVTTKTGKQKVVQKTTRSTKLAETDDAYTLVSKNGGTKIEAVYADHSNRLKALANAARKEAVNTKSTPYSPSAKASYQKEVDTLNAKLNVALKNRPLERQARIIANTNVRAKQQANPNMSKDELKKIKQGALVEARRRTGAERQSIYITDNEWAAIQAGAITNHKLTQILDKADLDRVKDLATPRKKLLMDTAKVARAQRLLSGGATQADVADALGVSLTTLKTSLGE